MKESIFSSIKSYIPNDNDPAENYLTELLAWALRYEEFKNFRNDFIKVVTKEKIKDFEKIEIKTQRYINNKYMDMLVIIDDKYHLIFEHKIYSIMHSIEDKDQLGFYLDRYSLELEKLASVYPHDKKPELLGILISVVKPDLDKYNVFTWQEIFDKIYKTGIENYEPEEKFIVENIWTFIQESGYNRVKDIDKESVEIYYKSVNLESNLKSLIENYIQPGLASQILPEKRFVYFNNKLSYEDRYKRRIGLSFYHDSADWKPNIFVGLMLDGSDHKLNDKIEPKNGLYSVVILEYDYSRLNKKSVEIKRLSSMIKNEIQLLDQGENEKIYDMHQKQWNAYRILVILNPLNEIFGDTSEHSAQARKMIDYYVSRIDAIVATKSFKDLFDLLNL